MDVFLDFPLEVTRMIVVEWVHPIDLVFLDTAYCNHEKREPWEEVLRLATHFANYSMPDPNLFALYQNWVFAREVPTTRLRLGKSVDSDSFDGYLQNLGQFVEEVTFQELDEDDFGVLAALVEKYCDNITQLACTSCELEATLMTMMNYKSTLRHLRITDCTDIQPDHNDLASWEGSNHMQLLSAQLECADSMWFVESFLKLVDPTIIQQFSIRVDHAVPQALLVSFFPFCYNLLALGFSGSSDFDDAYFNSVAPFCSNVLHLDISYCTQLTDDIADELVEGMTQLRTLNISGTVLTDVFINVLAAHYSHSLQALHASDCADLDEGYDVFGNSPALRILECSCQDIVSTNVLISITTLILSDDFPNSLAEAFELVVSYGDLENLRIVSNEDDVFELDFMALTAEALPRLHTLSVCVFAEVGKYDFDLEEPERLRELRAARPYIHVYFNTDELAYDQFKLPLHYDP